MLVATAGNVLPMSDDLGGDPPCWMHLFEDGSGLTPDDLVFATIMRDLADGVVIADASGTIVFWNPAAERIFGWTEADAVGKSLDLIIPDRHRTAHWNGYERVMRSGETRYGAELLRVPSLHADGARRSIAFTVTLVKGAAGAVVGIVAVVRDETQRWTEEQELRRQLRETAERSGA